MRRHERKDPSLRWFRDEMQERLKRDLHQGDWSQNPWWLGSGDENWFAEHGWPLERRRAAIPGLKKIYPPAVCRELLVQPWHGGLIYFLFQRYFPWFITPLLETAERLHQVAAHKDKKLLRALRNRDTFSSAAFELSVWANLARHGYRPEREPRTEKGTHPDFAVIIDHRRYFIELKILQAGEISDLAEEVQQVVFGAQSRLMDKGRDVTFRASEFFRVLTRKDRSAVEASLPELRELVRAEEERLEALGFPEGEWPVGAFGTVAIKHTAPDDGGWLHVELVPPLSRMEQAGRCMAAVRTALRQLTASGRGWIVVAVGRGFDAPQEVFDGIQRELGSDPRRNWDAVILFAWGRTIEGLVIKQVAVILRNQKSLTMQERRMVEAMVS